MRAPEHWLGQLGARSDTQAEPRSNRQAYAPRVASGRDHCPPPGRDPTRERDVSRGRLTPHLVAVVDLGSTAVRFRLVRIVPGVGYHVLAQERVATRLGDGRPRTPPRHAIDHTLRAVHRFFARHSSNGRGPRILAVATSAVRDARNRERLLAPLRHEEGIDVQILSARDEARLGVSAALANLPVEDGVVADLG